MRSCILPKVSISPQAIRLLKRELKARFGEVCIASAATAFISKLSVAAAHAITSDNIYGLLANFSFARLRELIPYLVPRQLLHRGHQQQPMQHCRWGLFLLHNRQQRPRHGPRQRLLSPGPQQRRSFFSTRRDTADEY
jgi:hypothetical protein